MFRKYLLKAMNIAAFFDAIIGKAQGIKKGNLPRFPIFINLKSNTMKNTMQR